MRILIDFDCTLFNTPAFKIALVKSLKPFGVSVKKFKYSEQELNKCDCYSPEKHLHLLVTEKNFPQAKKEFEKILSSAKNFLYPESFNFLKRLNKKNITILSFGEKKWQEQKIKNSGVNLLVENIITTLKPKEKLLHKWKNEKKLIIINDRGAEIDAMKKIRNDVFAVWVHRPKTPYFTEPCTLYTLKTPNLNFQLPKNFNF